MPASVSTAVMLLATILRTPPEVSDADRHRAVRVMHRAAGDGDILGGAVDAQAVGILAALDHDAVVAGVDIVVGQMHKAAGVHHDAIGLHARDRFR